MAEASGVEQLLLEAKALKDEMDQLRVTAQQRDASGQLTDEAYYALKRLDSLGDQYRQLLIAARTAPTSKNTVTRRDGSVWIIDPTATAPDGSTGTATQVIEPGGVAPSDVSNPDEDRLKAINAQVAESTRNERLRNEALGRGYLTTIEREQLNQRWADLGYTQDRIKLEQQKLENEYKYQDAIEQDRRRTVNAQIAQVRGQTALIGAQTGAITAKLDPEIAQIMANTGLTEAQAEALRLTTPANVALTSAQTQALLGKLPAETALLSAQAALANANAIAKTATLPEEIAAARKQVEVAQANIDQIHAALAQGRQLSVTPELAAIPMQSATGEITWVPSPAFQMKTPQDVATRAGQLRQQAQVQHDRLAAQVAQGVLSREEADSQFQNWWEQNIETQRPALEAANQQIEREQARLDEAQRGANLAAALGAGTQAVNAYQAQARYRVGPGFNQAFNTVLGALGQGKNVPAGVDYASAVSYKAPDLNQLAQQATMQALKGISPTAAMATGSPMPQVPQGLNVGNMLNRTNYQGWGGGGGQPITSNIGGAPQQPVAPAPPQPPEPPPVPSTGPWSLPGTPIMTTPTGQNVWSYPQPGVLPAGAPNIWDTSQLGQPEPVP